MNSPFEDILHSNTIPSDGDCQRIRELLAGPQREVTQLTEEIERLHALIEELSQKRDNLHDFIDPHLALLSPARRLPYDVVAEIFVASLPSNRNAVIDGTESPLLLCQICQGWRAIALSTPRLWASLHVVVPSISAGHKTQEIREAITWWLSKSAALPLSISIAQQHWDSWEPDASIVETLVDYAARWQHIRVKLDSVNTVYPLELLTFREVPILESIILTDFPYEIGGGLMAVLEAQNLTSFSLRQGTVQRLPLLRIHRWHNLRHLFLGEACESVAALDSLRRCLNLETCALTIYPSSVGSDSVSCRLPHLRRLSAKSHDDQAMVNFLNHIEPPELQILEIWVDSAHPFAIPLPLLSPRLHSLTLNIFRLPSDILVGFLRLLPSLGELELWNDTFSFQSNFDDTLWTAMIPTQDTLHDVLCPQLRILRFAKLESFPDPLLLEFVRARTEYRYPGIAPLVKVQGHFTRPMMMDVLPALQQAIADGLDISLRYGTLESYSSSEGNIAHALDGERFSDSWWDDL
ncbi:hypothetical protein C8R46DRAFT_1092348 [Mycena filopes]|nr:hypothetical protein C8R46DRAFT_1092348 [Mycena filopes]